MPVVALLGAGLWPLLQMTLLPPITFLFARWTRLFGAGAEGARGMMSTIAASMMSVVGVMFSMILVVSAGAHKLSSLGRPAGVPGS